VDQWITGGPAEMALRRADGHKRVKEKCRARGLLLASAGHETLQLFPSLTIEAQSLERGLDIIESCVGAPQAKAGRVPRSRKSTLRRSPHVRGSVVAIRKREASAS
jgi:hypothetical protein